jgi:prolyl oligopeptidase
MLLRRALIIISLLESQKSIPNQQQIFQINRKRQYKFHKLRKKYKQTKNAEERTPDGCVRIQFDFKKQNVFDDFIAAADYLIKENYTSSDYLAIKGGSNGGLLVGAVMTQRPDLIKVALPAVGVLDMLRYHTFTAGAGWAYDYGTAEQSAEMFEYIKGYSPVHNVKSGTKYPATLVTTGDHDDRVVPAHSFKFAAELQAKQSGDNPVLIRIEVNAGHGAGKSVAATIQENVDMQVFTLYNMGIKSLK